jgi:osmoprotectant transport system permease protein
VSLLGAGVLAAATLAFVRVAPNRIVSGEPLCLWQAADPWLVALILGPCLVLAAAALASHPRPSAWLETVGATGLLLGVLIAAGRSATELTAGSGAARVSLGSAFWVLFVVAGLLVADGLSRLRLTALSRTLLMLAVGMLLASTVASGALDNLSIARELANRRDLFAEAVARHVMLVVGALGPAWLIGAPLGFLALRRPALSRTIFSALNIVQTIPSIALFGLLINPLTSLSEAYPWLKSLGVRGIGMAPALIALTLYALLPVARSVHVGFAGVPHAVVDAARGMGLSRTQIAWQVSLPLALPVLLSGLRIVTVQLVGLAVVAALIGAGGLGSFVFQGLGQTATDLVLVGALSAIALALIADALLRVLRAFCERGDAAA